MVACVDRLLPFLPFDLSSASCISGRDGGSARERFWPSFPQAGTSFCGGARPAFTGPFHGLTYRQLEAAFATRRAAASSPWRGRATGA